LATMPSRCRSRVTVARSSSIANVRGVRHAGPSRRSSSSSARRCVGQSARRSAAQAQHVENVKCRRRRRLSGVDAGRGAGTQSRSQPLEVGQTPRVKTDKFAVEQDRIIEHVAEGTQLGELVPAVTARPRSHRDAAAVGTQLGAHPVRFDLQGPAVMVGQLVGRGQQHRLDKARQPLGHELTLRRS